MSSPGYDETIRMNRAVLRNIPDDDEDFDRRIFRHISERLLGLAHRMEPRNQQEEELSIRENAEHAIDIVTFASLVDMQIELGGMLIDDGLIPEDVFE